MRHPSLIVALALAGCGGAALEAVQRDPVADLGTCRDAPFTEPLACESAFVASGDARADSVKLTADLFALDAALCDAADDAALAAAFRERGGDFDGTVEGWLASPAYLAHLRARTCLNAGARALGVAVLVPGRGGLSLTRMPTADEERVAVGRLTRACLELPRIHDLPLDASSADGSVVQAWRTPAVLACQVLDVGARAASLDADVVPPGALAAITPDDEAYIAAHFAPPTFPTQWNARIAANQDARAHALLDGPLAALAGPRPLAAIPDVLAPRDRLDPAVFDRFTKAPVTAAIERALAPREADHRFLAFDPAQIADLAKAVPWPDLRDRIERFRAAARDFHLARARDAAALPGALAFHERAAVAFGADPAPESAQRFAASIAPAVSVAAVAGPCAFLAQAGAPGLPLDATLAVTRCATGERQFTTEDAYTYDAPEKVTVPGVGTHAVSRTVHVCHQVSTQSCTGPNSWSCYSNGSNEVCGDEVVTVSLPNPPQVVERMTPHQGRRTTRHRALTLTVEAQATVSAGAKRVTLPFRFERSIDQQAWSTPQGSQEWPPATYGSLESDAAAALSAAILGDADLVAAARRQRANVALAHGVDANKAGHAAETDDGYVTWLRLGGTFDPALAAWFDREYGLDEARARALLGP